MNLPERACEQCGRRFLPSARRHRFCKAACRVKASKARQRDGLRPGPEEPVPLVVAVRRELEEAGVVDSFLGRLALVLAARLISESGLVSISRELRLVMAQALDGLEPMAPAVAEPGEPEDPDELATLREERDRVTRHAATGRA